MKGKSSPRNVCHRKRNLFVTVHGDDFTSTGPTSQLLWFQRLLDAKYECKYKMLGPGKNQVKSVRVLNRTIEWTEAAITYEANTRHAELIIKQLGLEGAKSLSNPGTREEHSSSYKMIVARLNYLAMDRIDLQYATKEAAKHMSAPAEKH